MQSDSLIVVTLFKGSPDELYFTLKSYREQLVQVPLVVVDGTDEQVSKRVLESFSLLKSVTSVDCSTVEGIYPSMNFALELVKEFQYVWFMNSGDAFSDAFAVERVTDAIRTTHPEWIVGEAIIHEVGGEIRQILKTRNPSAFRLAYGWEKICHQAIVVRRETMESLGGFNEALASASDFQMMLFLAMRSKPCLISHPIAVYTAGGFSDRRLFRNIMESSKARRITLRPRAMVLALELTYVPYRFLRVSVNKVLTLLERGGCLPPNWRAMKASKVEQVRGWWPSNRKRLG